MTLWLFLLMCMVVLVEATAKERTAILPHYTEAFSTQKQVTAYVKEVSDRVNANPADPAPLLQLAHIMIEIGDYKSATQFFTRAENMGAASHKWILGKSESLLSLQQPESVISLIQAHKDDLPSHTLNDALAYLGQAHFARGDLDVAEELFLGATTKDPPSVLGWIGLGRMALGDGDYFWARELAGRAIAQAPKEPKALKLLADLEFGQGRVREGLRYLSEIKQVIPWNPFVRIRISEVLVGLGEVDEAQKELEEVAQLIGDHPQVHLLRGWVALRQGHFGLAEEELKKALALKPSGFDVRLVLAALYSEQMKDQKVVELLWEMRYHPDIPMASRLSLVSALIRLDENQKAYDFLRTIQGEISKDAHLLSVLANLAYEFNDLTEARGWLLQAQELFPTDEMTLQNMRLLKERLLNYQQGTADRETRIDLEGQQIDSEDEESLTLAFALALTEQRYKRALQISLIFRSHKATKPQTYVMEGLAHIGLKQWHEAELAFRQALQLKPLRTDAFQNLAGLFFVQEQLREGYDVLKEAIKHFPQNEDFLVRLVRVANELNEREEQAEWLNRLSSLKRPSESVKLFLAEQRLRQSEAEQARAILSALLRDQPENIRALRLATLTEMALGQIGDAKKWLKQWIELQPDEEALDLWRRMHRLESEGEWMQKNSMQRMVLESLGVEVRGGMALRVSPTQGKAEEAEKERSIVLNAKLRMFYNREAGLRYLERSMSEIESAPEALILLWAEEKYDSSPEEARQRLHEWVNENPNSVRARFLLSTWLLDLEDYKGARSHLELLLKNGVDHWEIRNNLAWCLMKEGHLYEALGRISGIDHKAPVLDTRGLIYLKLHQAKRAEQQFRAAFAIQSNPLYYRHLAQALLAQGLNDGFHEQISDK